MPLVPGTITPDVVLGQQKVVNYADNDLISIMTDILIEIRVQNNLLKNIQDGVQASRDELQSLRDAEISSMNIINYK